MIAARTTPVRVAAARPARATAVKVVAQLSAPQKLAASVALASGLAAMVAHPVSWRGDVDLLEEPDERSRMSGNADGQRRAVPAAGPRAGPGGPSGASGGVLG